MDEDQLREQLKLLHPRSYAWALRCCHGNVDDAEEVLQNAYVKVLSHRTQFRGSSSLKTWFFGVIRFSSLELFRDHQRHRERLQRLERDPTAFPSPTNEEDPRIDWLQQLLTELPDRQSQLLHLLCEDSLTLEEAASIMRISVGTARQHYHRAKQKLRELFAELPDER